MVNNGVIQIQGENQNATHNLSEQPESDVSHTQEPSSSSSQNERVNFTQDGDGEVAHRLAVSEPNNNIEQDPMDAVRKDNLIKKFSENCNKETLCAGKGLNNLSTNKS